MKYFILICFLSIHCSGFSYRTDDKTISKISTNEVSKNEAFLTSFMEGNQLYLNIPNQMLGKPVLFVRYDQTPTYKHLQVIWSLNKDKVLLKVQSINSTAGIIIPLKPKLDLMENILAIFPVEKKIDNSKSQCINITKLVLNQRIEWTPGFKENLVPEISLLLGTKDLDNEVIIKTNRGMVVNQSKLSIPVYFGFCALKEHMKARQYDYRMGFFNEVINGIPYGINNRIANINRWRLEKKYKDQNLSVPISPIEFILSPEIPNKWRPYIKAGIEEWLPAFESAGFKNAIVVKEVDSLKDWQAHSINTSVVHWGKQKYFRGSEDENFGGTVSKVVDFRTGEMLKCDIHLNASRENYEDRYFIRAAPLDKRARKFPFPDELIGEMYQCLAAHEAGHAFGIMDGNYGEYSYPLDKINERNWLEKMGFTPSIMNYSRPNNIAQPEDSIPPSLLIQKVGPTDLYNIKWAYLEFPIGTSPEEENAELESIIRLQDSISWYRYNYRRNEVIGPAMTDEVVETNDPINSTKMALKNIKRVIEILPQVSQDQKDNARLERLYKKTLELWYRHMRHVVSLIGGYEIHYKSINQEGSIYTPIKLEQQKEAIEFLIFNAFNPPEWLVHPEFIYRINYSTYPDKMLEYQQNLLFELLRPQRMKRLEYLENSLGNKRVTQKLLLNLQVGLFKELNENHRIVNPRRQELQSTYIDKLIWIVKQERQNVYAENKSHDYTDYSKGIFMEHLLALKKDIEKTVKRNKVNSSLGHWELCLIKINELL